MKLPKDFFRFDLGKFIIMCILFLILFALIIN